MSRVKGGASSHARHRKVVKAAAGYYGARSRNFRTARQTNTQPATVRPASVISALCGFSGSTRLSAATTTR